MERQIYGSTHSNLGSLDVSDSPHTVVALPKGKNKDSPAATDRKMGGRPNSVSTLGKEDFLPQLVIKLTFSSRYDRSLITTELPSSPDQLTFEYMSSVLNACR